MVYGAGHYCLSVLGNRSLGWWAGNGIMARGKWVRAVPKGLKANHGGAEATPERGSAFNTRPPRSGGGGQANPAGE